MSEGSEENAEMLCRGELEIQDFHESETKDSIQDLVCSPASLDLGKEQDSSVDERTVNHSLYIPNNHMTKSMLCLNEESQDEVSHR